MNKPVTAIIIGAGGRGTAAYLTKFRPDRIVLTGVAELDDKRRSDVRNAYHIKDDMCFKSYDELFKRERLADLVIISTNDRQHMEPAELAVKKGYHILLEKPISPIPEEVVRIGRLAEKYDRVFSVAHVLRYTPFFRTIKSLIDSGSIGKLMSVAHNENVAYWFQAQNFVRGKWNNSDTTSPMILAKSCHDLDIILYLVGADCTKLSSFGHLTHFKPDQAPEGAPMRCNDGCPHYHTCPYNIIRINLSPPPNIARFRKTTYVEDAESLIADLRTSPYGRCVYHCDNNVVDHQVVNMDFENEVTAVFTMSAFTYDHSRTIKLMGTHGEIGGDLDKSEIVLKDFRTGIVNHIDIPEPFSGHSGGDEGIIESLVDAINGNDTMNTSAQISVQSHMMAFAAEKSRLEGRVIDMREFISGF